MSDPAAPTQLLKGFYGLEAVPGAGPREIQRSDAPPVSSAQRGATLTFAFSIPRLVIQKLGGQAFRRHRTTRLKSETYSKPGSHAYSAEIPPALLAKEAITVDLRSIKASRQVRWISANWGSSPFSVSLESNDRPDRPSRTPSRTVNVLLWSALFFFLLWLYWEGLQCWFIADDSRGWGCFANIIAPAICFPSLFSPAAQGTIRPE